MLPSHIQTFLVASSFKLPVLDVETHLYVQAHVASRRVPSRLSNTPHAAPTWDVVPDTTAILELLDVTVDMPSDEDYGPPVAEEWRSKEDRVVAETLLSPDPRWMLEVLTREDARKMYPLRDGEVVKATRVQTTDSYSVFDVVVRVPVFTNIIPAKPPSALPRVHAAEPADNIPPLKHQ